MIPSARAFEPPPVTVWPDSVPARLAALALLESLNAELLSHPSATLTLDRWCAAHRLAPEGTRIVAERGPGAEKPADDAVRQALRAGPQERIAYRRVRLRCGERVLSEADNWYLPALLTEEMNHRLETTDTAFGRVVQPLDFHRRTLSATLLWQPMPEGWEMGAAMPTASGTPLSPPAHVLEHRAVLTLPDGTPFSALVETYTRGVLDFPWPVLP
ncbi:hypothetical protein V5F61_02610 [Xanthobacter sp. V8C-5]